MQRARGERRSVARARRGRTRPAAASAREAESSRMRCACDAGSPARRARSSVAAVAARARTRVEPRACGEPQPAPRVRRGAARAGAGARPGCARASRCSRTCRRRSEVREAPARGLQQAPLASARTRAAIPRGPARRARPRRDGVGARTSATKSAIVKSISWPDAAHDRDRAGEDRARDGLVVERPEVLERAAAARDDQHVAVARARPRA